MPENLQAARLKCAADRPYLSAALWALHSVPKPGLGTLAVDKWWRLYYDTEIPWTVQELAGVLYHEVSHLLRDHCGRAEVQPDLDHMAWNVCADAEINDDIIAEGVKLPDGCVTPTALYQKDGLLAEEYYQALPKLKVKMPPNGAGQGKSNPGAGNCGSAAGGVQMPWEEPGPATAGENGTNPGVTHAEGDLIRRQVAQDVKEASKTRGNIPAWMQRWAEEYLNPKVDWRKVLQSLVRHALADAMGQVDYTYQRPARRASVFPKIVMPALRQPIPSVAVVVDTSGSIGGEMLDAAMAEVNGVLKACGQKEGVRAIVCDANVKSAKRVFRAEQIQLAGGGGTDMRVGITEALKQKPHAIIVLTDGYTPWPDAPCGSKIIAALLGALAPKPAAWIKSVVVELGK